MRTAHLLLCASLLLATLGVLAPSAGASYCVHDLSVPSARCEVTVACGDGNGLFVVVAVGNPTGGAALRC